jgi:ribosome-binding factor A
MKRRIERINSLLREVIAQVIHRDVHNQNVHHLTSVTSVEVTDDLAHAKVFLSIIGTDAERKQTLEALRGAAGFVGVCSAQQVRLRHFPRLSFYLDEGVDKQMRIEQVLSSIHEEERRRTANG